MLAFGGAGAGLFVFESRLGTGGAFFLDTSDLWLVETSGRKSGKICEVLNRARHVGHVPLCSLLPRILYHHFELEFYLKLQTIPDTLCTRLA